MKISVVRLAVLILLLVYQVEGDYRLLVRSYSYSNPSNRCAGCPQNSFGTRSCCDNSSDFTGECSGSDRCDNIFFYCLREIGDPLNSNCDVSRESSANQDGATINFSQDMVLGLPNPLPLIGISREWNGLQFTIAVYDEDPGGGVDNDLLVDRYTTNFLPTDLPVGVEKTRMIYNGVFGFSQFELSFLVECDPGFSGEFCQINIDDCVAVNCSENGRTPCMDGNNTYECVCDPGFTGDQCEENINDCTEDSCNGNGQCVDEVNSFTCTCDPGFTGDQCEENIDGCLEHNCSGNGQCTDGVETFTCNCNLGFTGRMCGENIDDCVGVNCSGNGQCRDEVNSYTCGCELGFTGELCNEAISTSTEGEPSGLDPTLVAVTAGVVGGLVVILLLACLAITVTALVMKKKKRNHNLDGTVDIELKTNNVYGVNLSAHQRPNVQSRMNRNVDEVDPADIKSATNQAYGSFQGRNEEMDEPEYDYSETSRYVNIDLK